MGLKYEERLFTLKNDCIWRPHKHGPPKSSFLSQFKSNPFNSFFLWKLKIHTFERIMSHEHLACARAAIFRWSWISLNLLICHWMTLTEKMFKKDASSQCHFCVQWTPMCQVSVKQQINWSALELTIFIPIDWNPQIAIFPKQRANEPAFQHFTHKWKVVLNMT